jgi:transposase-like protein
MVTKFGLLTLGATRGLRAAKACLEQLIESWPGDYVVFVRDTGRVVAKASSEFQRG